MITIIKYKTHIFYILKEEQAGFALRFWFMVLQIFAIVNVLLVPAIGCSDVDN